MPDQLPAPSGRRITKKLGRALDALTSGEAQSIKAAAELAGMARETLSRALARPDVQAEVEARVRRLMGGASLARAHGVLTQLLEADSEHVRFKAAELILACNGIRPPERGVSININGDAPAGWIIDLRPDPDRSTGIPAVAAPTIIDVTPEGEEA